jgi:hypothetical protein
MTGTADESSGRVQPVSGCGSAGRWTRQVQPVATTPPNRWQICLLSSPVPAMDEDQAYRAMDLLVDADTCGRVQESVFFAVANLLNLEVDLLFFDSTSTYFERDDEDTGEDAFRRSDTPRTTAAICRRSSSGWPSPRRHPGALLVLARQQQRPGRVSRGPR